MKPANLPNLNKNVNPIIFVAILALTVLFNTKAISQTMVVNEIMFKPGPTVTGCDQKLFVRVPNNNNISATCGREYIELYNSDCNSDYNLSGYILGSCQGTSGVYENGGAFVFPVGTIVPAGGFLTVGGPDEDDGNNAAFTYTIGSIDIKLNTFAGTSYISTTSNGYWFLPNVDGWMALYEPNGNVHSAVYWSSNANNVTSLADFAEGPPSPAAYTGAALKSAKQIFQTTPALIQYVGVSTATNTGNTLSRIPDGGAFQPNRPSTVGPLRSQRCNDGACLACGNLTVSSTPDNCGNSDGTIVLTVPNTISSPAPYTYTITGPVPSSFSTSNNPHTITGLPAGTYSIHLVDGANPPNSIDKTIVIDAEGSLTTTATATADNCNQHTGTATVTPSQVASSCTYLWNTTPTQQTTQTATGLTAGNYTVTTSYQGCTAISTITVPASGSVTATATSTADICSQHNGTATITPSQVASSCTYLWNTTPIQQTTQTVTGLAAGSYVVTTTYLGCTTTTSVTVNASGSLSITCSAPTNPLCNGQCTGTASVTIIQGVAPYTYVWSNGTTTQNLTNLCAGTYIVTVTGNDACIATASVTITQPTALVASILPNQTSQITCFGLCDGSATVVASGGTPQYSYTWAGGGASATKSTLCSGIHTITVSDANQCTATTTVSITEPPALNISISDVQQVSCFNGSDGSSKVEANGGTEPYNYHWSNGITTNTANNLSAGNTSITVSDLNNCLAFASITITQPNVITLITSTNPVTCFGLNNGTANATVTGGTPGYVYQWSNGNTNALNSNIASGSYTVTVIDSEGCMITANANVDSPSKLTATISPNQNLCSGSQASIFLLGNGGTLPYSYYWNGSSGTSNLLVNPNQTTSFLGWIKDANGCESNHLSTTISIIPGVVIKPYQSNDSICTGEYIIVSANISGGTGEPYIIKDFQGNEINFPYNLYATHTAYYDFIVEDNCGSKDTASIYVFVYPSPIFSINSNFDKGCDPLAIKFTTNAPSNYTSFVWDFGDNENLSMSQSPVHVYDESGIFDVTLTVISEFGCKLSLTNDNMITVYAKPIAQFMATPQIISLLDPFVNFDNYSSNATSYFWDFGDGDLSNTMSPSHKYNQAGNYIVNLIAVSGEGCKDTVSNNITVNEANSFYAPNAFTPDGDNVNDVFFVTGTGISSKNFLFIIYDRWGEKIYETTMFDPEAPEKSGWNGLVKNKELASNGSYVWLVIYYDRNGVKREHSGSLTVIR